jgi:hypothetical protein
LEGLSHRQYYLQCVESWEMEEEDYKEVPYPHPYLALWLECKRYASPSGVPALPDPLLGPLDQDAETMLAFDVLNEAHAQLQEEEEARAKNKAAAGTMGFNLLPDEY